MDEARAHESPTPVCYYCVAREGERLGRKKGRGEGIDRRRCVFIDMRGTARRKEVICAIDASGLKVV